MGNESRIMIGGEEAVAQTPKDKGDGLEKQNQGGGYHMLTEQSGARSEGQRWVEATLIFL